jgi:hypothetical protein
VIDDVVLEVALVVEVVEDVELCWNNLGRVIDFSN